MPTELLRPTVETSNSTELTVADVSDGLGSFVTVVITSDTDRRTDEEGSRKGEEGNKTSSELGSGADVSTIGVGDRVKFRLGVAVGGIAGVSDVCSDTCKGFELEGSMRGEGVARNDTASEVKLSTVDETPDTIDVAVTLLVDVRDGAGGEVTGEPAS